MTLIARIEDELKQARLARDDDRRDALSLILSSLRSAEKELQRPLSEDEELQVLQRERKKRVEAAEAYGLGIYQELCETDVVWARAMQLAGACAAGARNRCCSPSGCSTRRWART